MSWLDTFKNDERSLYWLVKYIHHNNLFYVEHFPTNIEQAREIIQCWENESINGAGSRLQFKLRKLIKNYFANVLPIESFDWLSVKNPKQLSWVLFYINLNPISQIHFAPQNKHYINFASNIEEAYQLIIKTFDAAMTNGEHKQNYLLALKCAYSQYVIGKSPLHWLDMKDEATCSWVWRYLVEKVEEASGGKDTFQFIKPIDNETVYWSCISLIANWKFLKDQFTEEVKIPIFDHIRTPKSLGAQIDLNYFGNEAITKNNNETVTSLFNNTALFTPPNIEPINTSEYITDTYEPRIIYTDTNYPYDENLLNQNSLFMITLKRKPEIRIRIRPTIDLKYRRLRKTNPIEALDKMVGHFYILRKDKLPTTEELTTSLYNAHKQRIHRQKNNSPLGLTKANQKKLTNYAKEQNTTEKKALNEIVKAMLD
jgi:hypothetical protein